LTATEISKILGEDVDVVYYHLKFLKKFGLVSEPRVEVRGGYIEKYYSLTPEIRKEFARAHESEAITEKVEEMGPEEFRRLLMTGLALIQSVTAGAANQIKRVDKDVIADLKKKRDFTIQVIYCTRERYYKLLKNLKEIAEIPSEASNRVELGYTIAFWAMPKLEE
jgi:DNA-binding PadR family transcriptional regulator